MITLPNATQFVSLPNALAVGAYVIRINVSLVNDLHDLSNRTVVTYAYVNVERCTTPNITVDQMFASADQPHRVLQEQGFTVTMDYTLDCNKLEQVDIRWDVMDREQDTTFVTLPNATEFSSLPNALVPGAYVVKITMSMSSSFFDLSEKTAVSYAYVTVEYCQPPDVTLKPPATESSKPFTEIDIVGFTVAAEFLIDCPAMDRLNNEWEILSSEQSVPSVVKTASNASQIVVSPYELSVGLYIVRLNTTVSSDVLDLSEKAVTSVTYIDLIHVNLVAGIEGSSYSDARFNSIIHFSAYNLTYTSDKPPSDKSGMLTPH